MSHDVTPNAGQQGRRQANRRAAPTPEPWFDVPVVARMIPCSHGALRMFLSRHKAQFPARYRRTRLRRKIRILSASEVALIRRLFGGVK